MMPYGARSSRKGKLWGCFRCKMPNWQRVQRAVEVHTISSRCALRLRMRFLRGIRHDADSLVFYYLSKFIKCWRSNDWPGIMVDTKYHMWQKSRISSIHVVFHDRPTGRATENPQMVYICKVEG